MVSARGEYGGGAISPGIDISLEALGRRGAQLRKVDLVGRMLAEECTCFTARQPWLTLLGLEIVYSRNS